MLHDLNTSQPGTKIETSVCIVGAGPAGLALAHKLRERGIDCVILESGGVRPSTMESRQDVINDRREYRGATLGSATGIGGTSSIWGGQLLPIAEADLAERASLGIPAWPISYPEIARHLPELERWLGVDSAPYDTSTSIHGSLPVARLNPGIFKVRISKWIRFRRRNLGKQLLLKLANSQDITCWINAKVVEWQKGEPNSVRRVVARNSNGNSIELTAKIFAVCAGALESTRSILELQDQLGLVPTEAASHLGHYLHDHLSVRIGSLRIVDRKQFNELFAPVFTGSTMHSVKLELSGESAWSKNLPSLYAHFVAEVPEDSGFSFLRDTLRNMQRGDIPGLLRALAKLPTALPGVAEIAFWRLARKRLAFPADGKVFLHADFEQPPQRTNRIYLGNRIGNDTRKVLHIDWDLACTPSEIVKSIGQKLSAWWTANALQQIAELLIHSDTTKAGNIENLYDIYHPAGTTRMADSAHNGVVDPDLRLFGTTNVYVLSTSVFPSMGSANPTFTLLALAIRLAEHLDSRFKQHLGDK